MRGISWLAENRLASQEEPCSMEWVSNTCMSRTAMESTQPPIRWVLGGVGGEGGGPFPRECSCLGVSEADHSLLLSRLRVSGASAPPYAFKICIGTALLMPLPHTVLWEPGWGTHYSYQATVRGSNPSWGKRFFCSLKRPDPLWSPSIFYSMGTGFLFCG